MHTAVSRIPTTLDQLFFLKLIQRARQRWHLDSQLRRKRLLSAALAYLVEMHHHGQSRLGHIQLAERLIERATPKPVHTPHGCSHGRL